MSVVPFGSSPPLSPRCCGAPCSSRVPRYFGPGASCGYRAGSAGCGPGCPGVGHPGAGGTAAACGACVRPCCRGCAQGCCGNRCANAGTYSCGYQHCDCLYRPQN